MEIISVYIEYYTRNNLRHLSLRFYHQLNNAQLGKLLVFKHGEEKICGNGSFIDRLKVLMVLLKALQEAE